MRVLLILEASLQGGKAQAPTSLWGSGCMCVFSFLFLFGEHPKQLDINQKGPSLIFGHVLPTSIFLNSYPPTLFTWNLAEGPFKRTMNLPGPPCQVPCELVGGCHFPVGGGEFFPAEVRGQGFFHTVFYKRQAALKEREVKFLSRSSKGSRSPSALSHPFWGRVPPLK